MSTILRYLSAIIAIIIGLPTIFGAVFQCVTKTGYDKKNESVIAENFLEGSEYFIDETESNSWLVGYGRSVLTPDDLQSRTYYLGGFLKFPAQPATGVIDDICVRAVVLDDQSGRGAVAFAWIDTVGLMNSDIKDIRAKLSDITGSGKLISINIGATHTHSAIDTQGLWGTIPKSGKDEKYMDALVEKTAAAVRNAYNTRTAGQLYYSSEAHPEMFVDNRKPVSFDDKIHLFRFVPDDNAKRDIYIANFGAHPVSLNWGNTELSGDYPYYLEKSIAESKNADFIFVQGAIGGGIGLNMTQENNIPQDISDYEQLIIYCDKMQQILFGMIASGQRVEPIINVRHMHVEFTVDNFVFKLAERAKICSVNTYMQNKNVMLTSEIGYIEIGNSIKILEVPGEVLPEIVYGGFYSAEQAFNKTEYTHEALNTLFSAQDDIIVFGLCNDALGYFVPDNDYSTSNEEGHYEETVSTGSTSASVLSAAFEKLVGEWR